MPPCLTLLLPADVPRIRLPLVGYHVRAGYPNPAEDFLDPPLDLIDHVVRDPDTTFFMKVSGNSMEGAGIYDGDVLVIDREVEIREGRIVVAAVDGELTVKRLHVGADSVALLPEHPSYPPIRLAPFSELKIWGVVTFVVHRVQ